MFKKYIKKNGAPDFKKIKSKNLKLYIKILDKRDKFNLKNLSEAFYWIKDNINSYPLCKECNKNISTRFISYINGYKPCKQCTKKNGNKKREQSCLNKFGVKYPSQLKDIQEKIKQTNLDRFGVDYPSKCKEVQEKIKQTNLDRYGVENPMQCKKVQEKIKQTNLDKYGVDHNFKLHMCQEKRKKTFLDHYGVENPMQCKEVQEKSKKTCLEKYGVEYSLQSNEIKEKGKQTCQKKYGVDNPAQIEEIKEKKKNTCLKHFGKENPLQSNEIKEKVKQTNLKKYGNEWSLSNPEIRKKIIISKKYNTFSKIKKISFDVIPLFSEKEFINFENRYKKLYKWKCNNCQYIFEQYYANGIIPKCPKCYPKNYQKTQNEIYKFIKSLNIICKQNCRTIISPLELDIWIQEKKIAIEFNGLYWHGERQNIPKNYHLEKTKLCEENGIQLIHIFEDEWLYKEQIVKSRLKTLLKCINYKIYARKCKIKEIDTKTKNKFLNKYHIQGEDKSRIKLGAFYKDKLVAVMTFGKPRFNKKIEWELIRFCTISNFTIIGIAGKLLKYFKRNYLPKNIISYADRRWSEGNVYYKLGFKLDHISSPNYWYYKNLYRESRITFQKHKLKNLLKNFNPELTEWENMQMNGWDRIWDCGNLVFIYD